MAHEKEPRSFIFRLVHSLGPGFITGAADDDPSGIATYSQTGAYFGYTQLWTALFSYPFMTAIQEMCGRIGLVTGKGLAGIIRKHYPRPVLAGAVVLLLVANAINIGADLGAMAASLQLVIPIPFVLALVGVTLVTLGLEIFVPYPNYAAYLKYLTLSLLGYVAVAFIVTHDWGSVLSATLVPHIEWSNAYLFNIAAVLGTTISPYLFFWQADEEVEEEVVHKQIRGMGRGIPKIRSRDVRQMRLDTMLGMLFSNLITFFIITSVAATIGMSGMHTITTAEDAASALKPFAGNFAYLLFTLGILGTGLLAVPVLAGSAGYAVAEAVGWREGLGKRFTQAYGFYGVIAVVTLIGLFVNFSSIGAMTMLYYAAMINGVLAPPLMLLLIFIGNDAGIMGKRTNSRLSNILGIIITSIMGAVSLALIWSAVSGG